MELSTNAYLIIGIIAVTVLALLLRSRLRRPAGGKPSAPAKSRPSPSKSPAPPRNPYRAATIVAGANACEAVKSLQDTRFLIATKEAPQLPLPNCTQPKCSCKYSHYSDRREDSDADRRGPPGLRSVLHTHTGGAERRSKKRGRRDSDWE